ncbi:hypothetical protein K431DRAFT_288814 [Polychaeton citri CBS 116435]|uniref:Uncharacterized protein n=1 Tax=Polychaeton citri CBS 116435 TaxID=1314669 RepID=A0A9P4Q286_9PEZI|nr:hypothetical protein K431DRAFT_288814 [Polychaeton citri CBS 116435]
MHSRSTSNESYLRTSRPLCKNNNNNDDDNDNDNSNNCHPRPSLGLRGWVEVAPSARHVTCLHPVRMRVCTLWSVWQQPFVVAHHDGSKRSSP